jgi:hypothetical protein
MTFSFCNEITPEFLRQVCKDTGGYLIPGLNENLMLQCKGLNKIQNLSAYCNIKCLWIQENAIAQIEGLDELVELRTLYLHQNCLTSIANLDNLTHLAVLNISNNWITRLEEGETPDDCIMFWSKMPSLSVLYFHGNDGLNKIRHYRKKMINAIDTLKYLDERPIFDNEKRLALAWGRGGHEEESQERTRMQEEKQQELKRDLARWKELQERGRPLKEQREKEWMVQLETKKTEDEEIRQLRISRQQDFMTTEGLVRDEVVVEEYRATTALMQVADALKNLVGHHEEDRKRLGFSETKARENLAEIEDRGRTQIMADWDKATKPRNPTEELTEEEEYEMMLKELRSEAQTTDNMMQVLQGVFKESPKHPSATSPQSAGTKRSSASTAGPSGPAHAPETPTLNPVPTQRKAGGYFVPYTQSTDIYASTPKTGHTASNKKAKGPSLWRMYAEWEQQQAPK